MFPSFLTGEELMRFFEKRMNLFSLCINIIAKPDVIQMHSNQLETLPYNIKTAIFTILCKRGFLKDEIVAKYLLNPTITEVDLSECVVTDKMLSCIFCCRNLRKLDLSLRRRQTRSITTEVLLMLFPHLPLLNIIAIPHCKEVTDDVIMTISRSCCYLMELHIPNSSITDHGLQVLGSSLIHLSVINLLGTQITDDGIQNFVKGVLSNCLTGINIDKCPNVSVASSRVIVQYCPNIKEFTCGAFGEQEEPGLAMNRIWSKAKQVFWSV